MTIGSLVRVLMGGFTQISFLDLVDILIVAVLLYKLVGWTKQTQAYGVLKGVAIMFLLSILSQQLGLTVLSWVLDSFVSSGSIIIIVCIFYYVLSFICFTVSESTYLISIAEEEEENETIVLPESVNKNTDNHNNNQRVEQAITKWLEKRGHLKTGITIQDAVEEMQIPRYLLVQWIKNTEFEVFSRWITHLRVEEAKRLLTAHSEYSNEAIAHECGFSSRSYFQKIFREQTGMTPVEYQTKKTRTST